MGLTSEVSTDSTEDCSVVENSMCRETNWDGRLPPEFTAKHGGAEICC
jgi:hypothetical protein